MTLREASARLVAFFRKRGLDRELDEELAAHVEMATEDRVRRGMGASEARRLALIELGGIEASKERYRESRGMPWLDRILHDVSSAARALWRSPGVTLTAIATLALGIGVNAAVFTLTNAVLFKGFAGVDRNDRLVYISSRGYGCCVSYPDFEDWRARATSFEGMGVVHGIGVAFGDDTGFAEEYAATEISAGTFALVGQRPIIGRDFTAADEVPGAAPVAILSYRLWERQYRKAPAILGRLVRVNGVQTAIVGVMAEGFLFPQNQDLWLPLVVTADVRKREARNLWFAFGPLVDGATIESARAQMEAIGRQLAGAYPKTNEGNPPVVQTFDQFFVGPSAVAIHGALWGAVGFVLLIACANVANLMLVRAIGRSREVTLRMALGAGRWRIIRQLLIESVAVSLVAGFIGWWIAKWGVRAYALADRPWRVLDYTMDSRVLGYLLVVSLATGLLFGLAPALRLSALDVNATLKDGGRGVAGGPRGRRLSAGLVVAEMALAVVLLLGAGVMIRSVLKISTVDLGVKTQDIAAMLVPLPKARYARPEAPISLFDRLASRLETTPGVDAVALAGGLPGSRALTAPYELAGAAPVEAQSRPTLSAMVVSPGYFGMLGARLLSGRDFDDADRRSALPVAIVNERFANLHWPGEDPFGKRFRVFDKAATGAWLTIVGVVSNIVQSGAARARFDPIVYFPYWQRPANAMWVLVRARAAPASLAPTIRREMHVLDPDVPIGNFWTLDAWLAWPHREQNNLTALFLIFAAIALLLASVGLYAVVAHSVSQRTQEIGVRMAVGSTGRDVLSLVLRQGMAQVALGLAIGLVAWLMLNRLLKAELVQVSLVDPIALVAASTVLVGAAALSCVVPARRAMRVDPVVALRHE